MRKQMRFSLRNGLLGIAALGLSGAAMAAPIDLQLNIGTPAYYPPAVVATPPLMVWLPSLGVYAAYGSSQPIFYGGSSYYYFYGNRWWVGPAYRGPWRPIAAPPPGLQRWHPGDWQRVQNEAHYRARDPHWRQFRPQARLQPPVPQQYRPHRPEHGAQGWNRPGDRGPDHGNPGHGDHGHGDHGPAGDRGWQGDHGPGRP